MALLTYIIFVTVSNLLLIIDQICMRFTHGVPLVNTLIRSEPLNLRPRNVA